MTRMSPNTIFDDRVFIRTAQQELITITSKILYNRTLTKIWLSFLVAGLLQMRKLFPDIFCYLVVSVCSRIAVCWGKCSRLFHHCLVFANRVSKMPSLRVCGDAKTQKSLFLSSFGILIRIHFFGRLRIQWIVVRNNGKYCPDSIWIRPWNCLRTTAP